MFRTRLAAPLMAAAFVSSSAFASPVLFAADTAASAENTGSKYSGSLQYDFLGGTTGQLTITLNNDTPAIVGGYLTAIVFRFDTAGPASTVLMSSTVPGLTDTGVVNGAPFGTFMGGAGTGGQFTGGGAPSQGLAIGGSATFVWQITAPDASALNELSFLDATSQPSLVVRFRGLDNGGSDKVPGTLVPAPASLAMLAGGMIATRRRRA